MKKYTKSFLINSGLLFFGILTVFSGVFIQVHYHIGSHSGDIAEKYPLGLNYFSWLNIHRISIVLFSVLAFFHIVQHWKLYKTIIAKRLVYKNKQVIMLSVLFVFVTITGVVPWIIGLLGGRKRICIVFIEIHDKIAIVLSVFLFLHLIKRLKWFLITFEKIKKVQK